MMNPEKFHEIESIFPTILVFLRERGLVEANTDASRYFDVGEYGLALEEALEACEEWSGELPDEVQRIFARLAKLMEMDDLVEDFIKRRKSS